MREWYTGPQNVCSGGPVYEVNTYVPKGRNEGGRIATPTSSQWSVFNNYSLDINSETTFFLCWISFINNNLRNLCPSERKKNHFSYLKKKYFIDRLLFQNFKSHIFAFMTLFDVKNFGGVLWPLSFFLWRMKIYFAFQTALAEFFSCI